MCYVVHACGCGAVWCRQPWPSWIAGNACAMPAVLCLLQSDLCVTWRLCTGAHACTCWAVVTRCDVVNKGGFVQVRRRDAQGQVSATTAVYSENLNYGSSGDAGSGGSGGGRGSGGGGGSPLPRGSGGGAAASGDAAVYTTHPEGAAAVRSRRGDDGWGAVVGAAVPSGIPPTTDATLAQALNEQYSAVLDAEATGMGGFKGAVVGGVEGGVGPGQDAARAQVEAAGLPGAWVEHMQDLDDVAVLSAMSRGVEGGDEGGRRGRSGRGRGGAARAEKRRQRKSF